MATGALLWDRKVNRSSLARTRTALLGAGVAMSADGDTVWLSGWDDNTGGVAWVYTAGDDGVSREGQRLSGTDGGFADLSAYVNLTLSADGQTGLIGSAGNNSNMEETWVFDCHDESSQITHVFVLMLENHSFDNIFAFSDLPGIVTDSAGKRTPTSLTAPRSRCR